MADDGRRVHILEPARLAGKRGWMKEERYLDFDLAHTNDVPALLDDDVHFVNRHRLTAALGYKSPLQYRTEQGFP